MRFGGSLMLRFDVGDRMVTVDDPMRAIDELKITAHDRVRHDLVIDLIR